MFSHIMAGARDLARLGAFYDAVLAPLGLWAAPRTRVSTFLAQEPFGRRPASAGNGCMVAFVTPSPEAVREAHASGLAAGGDDEGAPGKRPRRGRGQCRAYLRDPEGNKLHAVHRGGPPAAD